MILTFAVFALLLLSYAVLMNAVVSTSKKLVTLEDSLISIQSQITQTEQEIIAIKRSITKDDAALLGYVSSSDVTYIKIKPNKTAFLNE